MIRRIVVEPLLNGQWIGSNYDGLLAVVGYETRARYFAENEAMAATYRGACGFNAQQLLKYNENRDWYIKQGFEVEEVNDIDYGCWVDQRLNTITSLAKGPARLCVDISSTSRLRLAVLIGHLMKSSYGNDIIVDFVYSFAKYLSGIEETVITSAGPVTPIFAGWADDPDVPLGAVFGLGYERDKAIGILEYLEPNEVWAFEPDSEETDYGREIAEANASFFSGLSRSHRLKYPVKKPYEFYRNFEAFIYGALLKSRIVILPFGPKIFALNSLLVAVAHYPRVSVWRVTGEDSGPAHDRLPTGEVVGQRVIFRNEAMPFE